MGTITGSLRHGDSLFGQTREEILHLLLDQPDRRYYLRQIARLIQGGSGAVQRELRHLSSAGVILREQEGRQVYFSANQNAAIFPELQGLLRKTAGAPRLLRQALAPLVSEGQIELAFIYGSVATGTQNAGSDVDLCLVGRAALREVVPALREVEAQLGREVNPSLYPPDEFRRTLRDGAPFLTRIVAGPKHFVAGSPDDLARLAGQSVAGGPRADGRGGPRPARGR